jgi:hypothetical protein
MENDKALTRVKRDGRADVRKQSAAATRRISSIKLKTGVSFVESVGNGKQTDRKVGDIKSIRGVKSGVSISERHSAAAFSGHWGIWVDAIDPLAVSAVELSKIRQVRGHMV